MKKIIVILSLIFILSAFSCTQSSNLEITCNPGDLECLKGGGK